MLAKNKYVPVIFMASDFAVLALLAVATVVLRYITGGDYVLSLYFSLWPALIPFILIYAGLGLYPGILLSPPEEIKKAFWGTTIMFLALGSSTFMAKGGHYYSRLVFIIWWALAVFFVPFVRAVIRKRLVKKPWWGFSAVIIGDRMAASVIMENLSKRPQLGLRPKYFVPVDGDGTDADAHGLEILTLDELKAGKIHEPVHYAVVAMPECGRGTMDEIMDMAGRSFKKVILVPDMAIRASLWATAMDFGGILGLELKHKLLDPGRMAMKRTLDFVLSLAGLIVLSPFFLAVAILVKVSGKGPVFFGQQRIGKNNRTITIYKFRTMVLNSQEVLQRYLDGNLEARQEWEQTRKIKNDPRITSIGRFLRRYSLDELPQLFNVLTGDISLVGPRPIVDEESAMYNDKFALYLRVKPGLTGLWQISGRNDTTYAQRIDLDTYYINNWSVWLDIYILSRTVPIVLKGDGAY